MSDYSEMVRDLIVCLRCGGPVVHRERRVIADVIQGAVQHSTREHNPHLALTARLLWVEDELRGICANCTLERVAQTAADARAEAIEDSYLNPKPIRKLALVRK